MRGVAEAPLLTAVAPLGEGRVHRHAVGVALDAALLHPERMPRAEVARRQRREAEAGGQPLLGPDGARCHEFIPGRAPAQVHSFGVALELPCGSGLRLRVELGPREAISRREQRRTARRRHRAGEADADDLAVLARLGDGVALVRAVSHPEDIVEGELVVEPLVLHLVEQALPPRHRHRLGGGRVAEEDHARVEGSVADGVARREGAPVNPLPLPLGWRCALVVRDGGEAVRGRHDVRVPQRAQQRLGVSQPDDVDVGEEHVTPSVEDTQQQLTLERTHPAELGHVGAEIGRGRTRRAEAEEGQPVPPQLHLECAVE